MKMIQVPATVPINSNYYFIIGQFDQLSTSVLSNVASMEIRKLIGQSSIVGSYTCYEFCDLKFKGLYFNLAAGSYVPKIIEEF